MENPPRLPLVKMMVANATLLSAIYLGIGLFIEVLHRYARAQWAEPMCRAMERLPTKALALVHAAEPLRDWYEMGLLDRFWIRVILGVTTVGIIFTIAVLVGSAMWAVRAWVERASKAGA